jgi:PAS domain S-box-containing protein/putative nucleotidyltransferase with HDIG domain
MATRTARKAQSPRAGSTSRSDGDALIPRKPLLARAEEVARLGSWRYDLATKRVWWSDGMYRILGLGPDGPLDDPAAAMVAVVHPQDRRRMRRAMKATFAGAASRLSQFRVLAADGTVRWIAGDTRQERDASGTVVAIVGVVQDVTDTKRAGESLARDAALDRAIAWLSKAMVATAPSIEEIADLVLADAKDLTGSPLGFVSLCDPGADQTGSCTPVGDTWIIDSAEVTGPGAQLSTSRQWGWFADPEAAFYTNSEADVPVTAQARDDHVPVTSLMRAPAVAEGRFVGQIAVANAPGGYTDEDLATVKRLAALFAIALLGAEERAALLSSETSLRQSNQSLERMVYGVLEAIGRIAEARDPYTQGHEVRVAKLAKSIAKAMHLPPGEAEAIEMAGLVHDIGKLSVPAEILTKPGQLSANEFALIKEHPGAGYNILKDIEFPWPIADIVLAHHERMDGTGYPRGLEGADIPLASRVLAVADVVEAMASHRPYRPALGLDAAAAELTRFPGRYDPDVVRAFLALYESGRVELGPVS